MKHKFITGYNDKLAIFFNFFFVYCELEKMKKINPNRKWQIKSKH
jgi:hypothetical protein